MSGTVMGLDEAVRQSHVVHAHADLLREIARVGREIDTTLAGQSAVFLTVMNGALIFAGHLALAIKTPLEFDYVHATRFHGGTEGRDLKWLRRPAIKLEGRQVILVDDILDEGHTLKAVRDACLEAGAAQVHLAVLCVKRHARRCEGIKADFQGVDVPDAYVFGFGMDYHELGRNLPDILALDAA